MLSSTVLLVGLVVSQPPSVGTPEEAPTPAVEAAPIAPLPETDPVSPSDTGPSTRPDVVDGAEPEEIAPGAEEEMPFRHPRERRGLPSWGWAAAADGWYPSSRHMQPYIEPHFGRHHYPYWSWKQWWCSPGDMVPHLAYYPTLHSNYYSRPYHTMQIPHHQSLNDGYDQDPRNPYDNRIFEKVYESLRKEKEAAGEDAMELIEPDR